MKDGVGRCRRGERVPGSAQAQTGIVPGVGEKISYQMPTFTVGGRNLVYVGAWQGQVGLYPLPKSDAELDEAMDPYRAGKGTLRFPFGEPLPTALIEDVVRRLHRDLGSI
ncbi:MAG TPA: DUF1801 domain-containing protein [Acidimicrobiia bacterium]|nr:DUF1801 domain-containing protein [Acidimicrobiia bacterium]